MYNLHANIQRYFISRESRNDGGQLIYAQRFLKARVNTDCPLQANKP